MYAQKTIAAAVAFFATYSAFAQPACPGPDCGPISRLSQAQKDQLQDPFFRLVLAREPNVRRLDRIQELIRGATGTHRIFVVSEEIRDPRRSQGRRAVVDFQGTNGGIALGENVMLSFSFDDTALPVAPELEAWGFDERNGVYNYYKSEGPSRAWNFRASSREADRLNATQRADTCLLCHTSGVPIMKEMLFPWNNWHSGQGIANYLQPTAPDNERWPVANQLGPVLGKAEDLESAIKGSITRFNNRKFTDLVKSENGKLVVADAQRVLRPLFVTTEINFASATQRSGMHPLPNALASDAMPLRDIAIPSSFFLADKILAGGRGLPNGLGIGDATRFSAVAVIKPPEYKDLIDRFDIKLTTRLGERRGDTDFAWFTPEMGFVAAHWILKLVEEKVVSPGFVAAAVAADLETPIFSVERARLLRFIPPNFTADPAAAGHPDALTTQVITRLRAQNPAPESAAGKFLAALESPDPIQVVQNRVKEYKDRIETNLRTNGQAERERLFRALIQRRKDITEHLVFGPVFGSLIEFDALLPSP